MTRVGIVMKCDRNENDTLTIKNVRARYAMLFQDLHRALRKVFLIIVTTEGLSTKLYQIARSKIKCFRK